jgi:hypothetical protein
MGLFSMFLFGGPFRRAENDNAPEAALRGVAGYGWRDQLCERRAMKMS